MCKQVGKKLDFSIGLGKTCHYKTVSDILKYYNCDVPEEFVFLALRAFYERDKEINIPVFCRDAFERIGFILESHHTRTEVERVSVIEGLIDKGIPVIVNVNGKVLPYFPKILPFNFSQHLIVICGYNQDNFYVADAYVPFYPPESFDGWVGREAIMYAVEEGYDKEKVYTIKPGKPEYASIEQIFEMAILRVLEMLLSENEFRCGYFEKYGIRNLCEDEDIEELAKKTRNEILSNGGPTETREFLSYIFGHFENENKQFKYYSEKLSEFSKIWNEIANACLKFAVIKDKEYFIGKVTKSYEITKEEIGFLNMIKTKGVY